MGAFEDVHHRRVTGSLAMFDRMIFKGHLMRSTARRLVLWTAVLVPPMIQATKEKRNPSYRSQEAPNPLERRQ